MGHCALKVQQLVEKGWCNESAATINLMCSETFKRERPEKLNDSVLRRQIRQKPTVMEPSIHTLFKIVDAEDITNEKIRTLDLPVEDINVTSKLESRSLSPENCDPNPEFLFAQISDPNQKSKPQFRKYGDSCRKPKQSVSKFFRKQSEDIQRKRKSYSGSKSPVKLFIQYFKAYQKQFNQI